MANSKYYLDTMQILGPEGGERGESMLENTVYGVNMNFLRCKYPTPFIIAYRIISKSPAFEFRGAN